MKVVCLGDSLTYGFPYDESISWATALTDMLEIETVNRGINGDTTLGMLNRFYEDVVMEKPTYVVIMGGTNDAYIGVKLNDAKENISKIVEEATKNDIIPVLALMPPVSDASEFELKKLRESIKELAAQKEIYLLDFYSIFLTEEGEFNEVYFCDDCHPNQAGYQRMSQQAALFFRKLV